MLALTILATLCGAVLAFRYKAPILFPVIVCAVATALAVGLATRADRWSIILGIVAITVAVQFGFVFGMFTRNMIAGSRAASMRRSAAARKLHAEASSVFPH